MFISIFLIAATASASTAENCLGKSGQALNQCLLDAVEAIEKKCDQVRDGTPAAPRASSPRSSGPSRTQLAIEELRRQVGDLQRQITEMPEASAPTDLSGINTSLDALTKRIEGLENAPPAVPPPQFTVEPKKGDPGEPGAPGRDGRDGTDGQPAEITAIIAVDGAHSQEWNLVGGKIVLRVGGRPTHWLRLGGYASGLILPGDDSFGNDLGFGVGGYAGVDAVRGLVRPMISVGWREIGLDITPHGSRRSIQGVEVTGTVEVRPVGSWVIDVSGGGYFPSDGPSFTWSLGTGVRF